MEGFWKVPKKSFNIPNKQHEVYIRMYIKTQQEEYTNMHKLRKVRYNKENDEYMHSNYIYVRT